MEESLDRRRKWKAIALMVQEDRAQNAAGAHEERLKGLPASAALPSEMNDDDDLGEEFYN